MRGRPAISAQASITLPDGRKLVGQVDGGSGHSGRRSQDIHLGLGKLESKNPLDVALKWRDAHGQFQQTTLKLTPGWHTVVLGNPNPTKLARRDFEWNETERSGRYSLSPSDGERCWCGSEDLGTPASILAEAVEQEDLKVPRYIRPLSLDPSPLPKGRGKPQRQVLVPFHIAANEGGAR